MSASLTKDSGENLSIKTPKISANAMEVLKKRYLAKGPDGKTLLEDPAGMFRRVANNLAQAEARYGSDSRQVADEFYDMMSELRFLPNSPTLMNAGRELQQLSACFVLPVPDSIPEIFDAIKYQAIIHKTGGGTGFSFSRLRPSGDIVKSTAGIASGPISFMKIFDAATAQIKQGGTRRGANMAILRVDHPDILQFIEMKMDLTQMTNFNVSVAITDKFMAAWKAGVDYELIHPKTKAVVGHLSARMVMDLIAHNAWKSGEPGLFFIDKANATNPVPHIGEIEATNPCGEQDLLPYDSCNLGSIVLDNHMTEVKPGKWEMDWEALRKTIWTAVRLLDDVIDMNNYPLPEIEKMSKGTRRIGLGVMGFARMLFRLGVAYDSEDGVAWGDRVSAFINREANLASEKLGVERGYYDFYREGCPKRRNAYVTTVAPTGTISMIADTSGGCEPEFSLIWYKNVMDGTHLPYVLTEFMDVARREGFYYDGIDKDILSSEGKYAGSCRGLARVPETWQRVFAVSSDIKPEWHVKMQAAFQKNTDAAVSKTINLPKSATEDEVKKAYLLAFDLNCKGITVYRDGSRQDQVLNVGTSDKKKEESKVEKASGAKQESAKAIREARVLKYLNGKSCGKNGNGVGCSNGTTPKPRKRPQTVTGSTQKIETGFGTLYVTINEDDHGIVEVFANLGKSGGYTASFVEAIGRTLSLALRSGVSPEAAMKQLAGIRSPRVSFDQGQKVLSVPDAISIALRRYLNEKNIPVEAAEGEEGLLDRGDSPECPECNGALALQEGCVKCHSCGYSEC